MNDLLHQGGRICSGPVATMAGFKPSKWTNCEEVQQAFPEGCAELHQGTTIVTGPTTGIGVTTAIALAATGGRVVLAARSRTKAEALADQIRAGVPDAGPVVWIPLDLRSLRSVAHSTFARSGRSRTLPRSLAR
jgi:hypothetical protein